MRYSSLNTLLYTGKRDSPTYKIRSTLQAKNRHQAHGDSWLDRCATTLGNIQPDIHTITTVMSQHKILQGPLAANVKSNYIK